MSDAFALAATSHAWYDDIKASFTAISAVNQLFPRSDLLSGDVRERSSYRFTSLKVDGSTGNRTLLLRLSASGLERLLTVCTQLRRRSIDFLSSIDDVELILDGDRFPDTLCFRSVFPGARTFNIRTPDDDGTVTDAIKRLIRHESETTVLWETLKPWVWNRYTQMSTRQSFLIAEGAPRANAKEEEHQGV